VAMTLPAALDRGGAPTPERAALFAALCVVIFAMREAGLVGEAVRLTDAPPPEFGMGASGPDVATWQRVIGVRPDAHFGPVTLAASRSWALAAGFGDRLTVTPAMWATAIGTTFRFVGGGVELGDGSRVEIQDAAAEVARVLTISE